MPRPRPGTRSAAVAALVAGAALLAGAPAAAVDTGSQDATPAPTTTVADDASGGPVTTIVTGVDRADPEADPDGATQPVSAPPAGPGLDSDGAPIWPWGLAAFGGGAVLAALSWRRRPG